MYVQKNCTRVLQGPQDTYVRVDTYWSLRHTGPSWDTCPLQRDHWQSAIRVSRHPNGAARDWVTLSLPILQDNWTIWVLDVFFQFEIWLFIQVSQSPLLAIGLLMKCPHSLIIELLRLWNHPFFMDFKCFGHWFTLTGTKDVLYMHVVPGMSSGP